MSKETSKKNVILLKNTFKDVFYSHKWYSSYTFGLNNFSLLKT